MSDQLLFDRPFIAYDGSKNCDILLNIYKQMCSKFEQITFVHICNPDKNYIPYQYQGPQIVQSLRQKLDDTKKQIEIKLIEKTKEESKTVNQLLLLNYFSSKSTFLLFGFYGSKGEKIRPEDLSTRVRRFVYDSKLNVAIIKNQLRGTNSVGYCCDGSEVSLDGLSKCLVFCKKFGYSLKVFHSFTETTKAFSKILKNQLKAVLASHNVKNSIVMEQSRSIVDLLKDKQQTLDWVFLTRNGYRGQITKRTYIGSKTTDILVNINSNIIIVS